MAYEMKGLLKIMYEKGASDLHITNGTPPRIRVDEILMEIGEESLTPQSAKDLTYSILSKNQIDKFEREMELDLSFGVDGLGRFRVNVFKRGTALQ